MMCKTIHDYDTLGNERHEAVSKLREIPDEIESIIRSTHATFFRLLANAIGIREHITFATVRDRLIYLIGGDKEADDGLADSVRDSGERMGVHVDGGKGEVTEPDAIAEYHRALRRMLGEVKGVHDKLVTQAESHAKLKHECRMYRAMLNDAAKEYKFTAGCCDLNANNCISAQASNWTLLGWRDALLELLKDAANEFQDLMEEHKCCRDERDAYMQNCNDIINGEEIDAKWFERKGYIELPKGKDGKHIHIGDTVRWGDKGEPFKVRTIEYHPSDVSISDSGGIYVSACHCNHVDDEPDPTMSAFDKYDAGLLTRDELVAALREAS